MTDSDQQKFAELMYLLGEAFDKEPSATKVELYFTALKDLPIETVSLACSNIVKTRKITGTFPLVAEILEAAQEPQDDMDTRIAVAWDKLQYALCRHGAYDTVIFDDPVIHQILKSWGGWVKWSSEITDAELKWARKDFAVLYKSYAALPLPEPEPMEGIIAQQNRNDGYLDHIPEPVLITGQIGNFNSLPFQSKPLPIAEQKKIAYGD